MSYLTQYATRRLGTCPGAPSPGTRVDDRAVLNLPDFDGGAHVRAFVEDTSPHRVGRRVPSPNQKLRIADCVNDVHLAFSVDSPVERENSLHKIDTLIAVLVRFRDGLAAEAELRERRE
jgi:hypothetical protein